MIKRLKTMPTIPVPLSVPSHVQQAFIKNYTKATRGSDKLFLFAGDQKIEHLNADFFGPNIPAECNDPKNLFKIASQAPIGVFATQLGMIARYAHDFPTINYLVKLNAKTNLLSTEYADPISRALYSMEQILHLKEHAQLSIVGVGYTVYLGSEHESLMLQEASQIIAQAHALGLVSVLWMYPRGKAVKNERDPNLIAGAAGVGHALGADFVKVNLPEGENETTQAQHLQQVVQAAGNTRVICSGGPTQDSALFLRGLEQQLTVGGVAGAAIGRNIHQKALPQAVAFCKAVAALMFDECELTTALDMIRE
ncbi:MAG: aldolase [Epsilonproteobacteria bacterium]|nr:aldolase [Campylobacterota bacterium]